MENWVKEKMSRKGAVSLSQKIFTQIRAKKHGELKFPIVKPSRQSHCETEVKICAIKEKGFYHLRVLIKIENSLHRKRIIRIKI